MLDKHWVKGIVSSVKKTAMMLYLNLIYDWTIHKGKKAAWVDANEGGKNKGILIDLPGT